MTLRPSWRSTLETWVVQAVGAVDHVVAGEVVAAAKAVVTAAVMAAVIAVAMPLGRSVEEGLTR